MAEANLHDDAAQCAGKRSMFQIVADNFPVARVPESKVARACWQGLFYVFRPCCPVELTTPNYKILAHPRNRMTLGRRILKDIDYEPGETALFRTLLKPGQTVLDIGANIGHFSMISGLALKESGGRVHAFEPTPVCYEQLCANLELNGLDNVTAYNLALSDEDGEVEIFTDTRRGGHHSMARGNVRELEAAHKIPARKLDDFIHDEMGGVKIDLIKMDTQGAEAAILAGAKNTLEKDMPTILMEFWPTGLERFGAKPWALYDSLLELGYTIREIAADGSLLDAEKTEIKGRLVPMGEKGSVNLLLMRE